MSSSSNDHPELERLLTGLLRRRLGQCGPWPAELYRHVAREASARSLEPAEWLSQVETHAADLTALVVAATVGHTGFFRHPDHFERLTQFAAQALRRTPILRIWSLGCSTGEEAWSIALCLRERAVPFQVWATDINPRSIEVARRGSYAARTTGGLHRRTGPGPFTVPDDLRRSVRFEVAALTEPLHGDAPVRFDVVFCRNVLIYLEPSAVRDAWSLFLSRIEPWGAIVVGPVESLNHVPSELGRRGPLGWFERTGAPPVVEAPAPRARPPSERPVAIDPCEDLDALLDRASRELASGDLERAESTLRSALDRRDDAVGWFLLGETYTRRGETTQAKLAYSRATKAPHAPENADLETIREAARRRALQLAKP